MKIIIVGKRQSGKTTLLNKIIKTNPNINFSIADEIENSNITLSDDFIITTQDLDLVSENLKQDAIIVNTKNNQ